MRHLLLATAAIGSTLLAVERYCFLYSSGF